MSDSLSTITEEQSQKPTPTQPDNTETSNCNQNKKCNKQAIWIIVVALSCFLFGYLIRSITPGFQPSSKLKTPQKIITSRWDKCKSDTKTRTGIASLWNIRQPIDNDPQWLLINDICIDSNAIVEKGDSTFVQKTEKGFNKKFEFAGPNKSLTIVTIFNMGDSMMIQGIHSAQGVMKQSRTWNIKLGNNDKQDIPKKTKIKGLTQTSEETIPPPIRTSNRRLLRKKIHHD